MYSTIQKWGDVEESTSILNDYYTDVSEVSSSFSPFSRLPVEIALLIWEQALIQTRLIGILVRERTSRDLHVSAKNRLGLVISGRCYRLQITTQHVPSPLLQTNRESRRAALEFCRVHIPCYRIGGRKWRFLYINPELDFLSLQNNNVDRPELLADFIHDLKALDPRGVGILNLGIECRWSLSSITLPSDPMKISPHIRQSFTEIISCLHYVFFYCIPHGSTRILHSASNRPKFHLNRAYPIHSSLEAFDFVEPDPRSIDPYFEKVKLGRDPRALYWLWRQMERKFGITHKPSKTRFAYHITTPLGVEDRRVWSRESAVGELRAVYKAWRFYEDADEADNLGETPIPAFGFWILPLEALEEISEDAPSYWDNHVVVDLSKHRPKLGVARLLQKT